MNSRTRDHVKYALNYYINSNRYSKDIIKMAGDSIYDLVRSDIDKLLKVEVVKVDAKICTIHYNIELVQNYLEELKHLIETEMEKHNDTMG